MRRLAAALLAGAAVSATIITTDSHAIAAPGDGPHPNPEAEAVYLDHIHAVRDGQGTPQLFESDDALVSDGYYVCHLSDLGQPPNDRGSISPVIVSYALDDLCAAYNAH
jgi:hypothetical protein